MANIIGTAGNDLLEGEFFFSNTIDGLQGNDTIIGGGLDNTINGGEGDDVISSRGRGDLVNGDAGNDTISGGFFDTIDGGDGIDTLTRVDLALRGFNVRAIIDIGNPDQAVLLNLLQGQLVTSIENIGDIFTSDFDNDDVITVSGSQEHTIETKGGNDLVTEVLATR